MIIRGIMIVRRKTAKGGKNQEFIKKSTKHFVYVINTMSFTPKLFYIQSLSLD